MKRPETKEQKYWDGDRFRHLQFIEDIEKYTDELEQQVKNLNIPAVIKCDSFEREVSVCCDTYIKIGATCYQNMNVCIGKKCKYYPAN